MNDRAIVIYRGRRSQPERLLDVIEFGRHTTRAQIEGRRLPHYAAVFVESGNGQLTTDAAGKLDIVGPSLFWIAPGLLHSYGPRPGTAWSERWALFGGRLAAEFETLGLIDLARGGVHLANATEMVRLFGALHAQMLVYGKVDRSACAATLHSIIVAAAQQAVSHKATDANVERALDALQKRALEYVDLGALCDDFAISPATLRRHCIRAYGMPPKVLQTQLRLDRAKELLGSGIETIEQIAEAVGFQDPYYFSRAFARHEGIAPSQFRRLSRR